MKTLITALVLMLFVWSVPCNVQAGSKHLPEGIFLGKIVEMSGDHMLLQVGDYNFSLGPVLIDDGSGEKAASRFDLQEGQLVEVEVGFKGEDISEARKVVILKGSRLWGAQKKLQKRDQ
ncbi:hypothetical protein ACUUL3_11940 [Thiovibrio sp. JS02]